MRGRIRLLVRHRHCCQPPLMPVAIGRPCRAQAQTDDASSIFQSITEFSYAAENKTAVVRLVSLSCALRHARKVLSAAARSNHPSPVPNSPRRLDVAVPFAYSLSNVVRLLVSLHALRQRESDSQSLHFPHNAALEVHLAGNVLDQTAQVLLQCQLQSTAV